jgi:hypothetical protein
MPKEMKDYTELELLEIQSQSFQELIRSQSNVQAIQAEINRRKEASAKKSDDKTSGQDSKSGSKK